MSMWYKAKKDDIDLDGDEINIYAGYDDSGSIYVTVKVETIKEFLKNHGK